MKITIKVETENDYSQQERTELPETAEIILARMVKWAEKMEKEGGEK